MWFSNYVLPVLIAIGVMLLVLWPTERSGHRLLRNWGVPHPRPDQVRSAVRYLWQRRILYIVFFLGLPPLAGLVLRDKSDLPGFTIVVPLLVAMLIAELLATLRPVGGVRVASLDPRGWRDLVPRWSVVAMAVLVVITVAWSVAGLVAQPWADRYAAALPPNGEPQPPTDWRIDYTDDYRAQMTTSTSWFALGYAAAALLMTVLLVRLAVRRPSVDDAAVDAALRTRTARVGVGIGLGWLGAAVAVAGQDSSNYTGLIAQIGAILCWIWVANPTRRSLASARA
jgi:hypothetical protein